MDIRNGNLRSMQHANTEMRVIATSKIAQKGFVPFHVDMAEPGGTIGRCAGNTLVLPAEEGDICRLQAVMKVVGDDCYLLNLSGMTDVRVNGHRLQPMRQIRLCSGDELVIGSYILNVLGAAEATVLR